MIEPHAYTDRLGRNLCDICDKWQGNPAHRSTPVPASNVSEGLRAKIEAAIQRFDDIADMVEFGGDIPTEATIGANDLRAALAHAAPEERQHSHWWIDGELHLNGCTLPHDYPRMTFPQPDATEEAGRHDP